MDFLRFSATESFVKSMIMAYPKNIFTLSGFTFSLDKANLIGVYLLIILSFDLHQV